MSTGDVVVAFPFCRLPVEVVLHIIHLASIPDFSPKRKHRPYATTVALCLVSSLVRRVTIPNFLHTVVLPHGNAIVKFVHALRMQRDYGSDSHPLLIDYPKHVRRMWIRETSARKRWEACIDPVDSLDPAILAPVLLNVPALAVEFKDNSLLCSCLKWALRNQTASAAQGNKPIGPSSFSASHTVPTTNLPWRTTTLTVSGEFFRWRRFSKTREGATFLAHISSLVILSPSTTHSLSLSKKNELNPGQLELHTLLSCASAYVPWSNFRGLRDVTVSIPRKKKRSTPTFVRDDTSWNFTPTTEEDIYAAMLTLEGQSRGDFAHIPPEVSLIEGLDTYIPLALSSLVNVEVGVHIGGDQLVRFDWEGCWASGSVG